MADIQNLGLEGKSDSAGDASDRSSLAPWQKLLSRWQSPIAFGPFVALVFISIRYYPNAKVGWPFVLFAIATVFWAVAVAGYALYLKYQE